MISYTDARKLLIARARSFGKERIGLAEAYGRVLSEIIRADRDYPPFDRSSVDGYAINTGDLEKGIREFTVAETIYAGAKGVRSIQSGECYKIMTGAPVPAGADAVIRREDVQEGPREERQEYPREEGQEDGQRILTGTATCRPFQNIARKGEDMHAGDTILEKARRCEPALVGLLASLGKYELVVERLPRVALLTTGNEVMPVESEVREEQIRNSNRWLLQSFLNKWGISPSQYEHVPDDREVLRAVLEKIVGPGVGSSSGAASGSRPESAAADLIILTGGVSAGDADHVPGVLDELGVRRLFHKLAIKPGKPAWCGVAPGGGMVFALPGNPFSCLVGFVLLIQPWLSACFGLPVPEPLGLPLRTPRKKRSQLDEFFPVRIAGSPAGLEPVALNGSGDVRLGPEANALALHPVDSPDLAGGTITQCYPF